MRLTGNLGLKKPEGTDVVNIDDLNQNFDILDVEVTKLATTSQSGRMSAADKVKLDGIEPGAQRNTVTSVNNKTGAVILAATDVGAETPAGAQTKANQAEANAKAYADQKLASHLADTTSKFTNINLNIIDMAVELETLKGATLNGVTANIFIETFNNLNDINLMNGIYDSTNKRLVL